MYKKRNDILIVAVSLLSFINIFLNIIPSSVFVFIILLIHLVALNRYENAFLWLLYGGTIGSYFSINGVIGVGAVLYLLSIVIFISDYEKIFSSIFRKIIPLILIFVLFAISALITDGGNYAGTKFTATIYGAFFSTFAFGHYLMNQKKYRSQLVSIIIIIYALFSIRYVMDYYNLANPRNIFDIGFLRVTLSEINIRDYDFIANYQSIGFMGCIALSILILSEKEKDKSFYFIVYTLSSIVVIYSGSRQAYLTLILIWSIDILRKYTLKKFFRTTALLITLVMGLNFILVNTDIPFINEILQNDNLLQGSGRSDHLEAGLKQFFESPFIGVGYGRYTGPKGDYGGYPHNFIIELLCETGIVGFLSIVLIVLTSYYKNKSFFRLDNTKSFGLYFILITFLIRALISGGMHSNIQLFSFVFLMPLYKPLSTIKKVLS